MPKKNVLNSESESILYLSRKDKRLAKLFEIIGEISYSFHDDGYVFLVHEIVEQMLSIKAAAKIFSRLEERCGNDISIEVLDKLSDEEIRSVGMSSGKVSYIRALNDAIRSGQLELNALSDMSDKEVISHLTKIKGIGNWTAKMYLIFVLDRSDVLPYEDVAFQQSYKWLYNTSSTEKADIIKRCKKWSPYATVASRYLYRALDMGLTKTDFKMY